MKEDKGKPRLDLIPYDALVHIARAMEYGAKKYEPHDWRKGQHFSLYASAAARHLHQWIDGEDHDTESGENHLAHVGACVIMLLTWIEEENGTDDRYKP